MYVVMNLQYKPIIIITKAAMEDERRLLKLGHIQPSKSPWRSNITLVKKSDGSKRIAGNYIPLNACLQQEVYPLPTPTSFRAKAAGKKWFA